MLLYLFFVWAVNFITLPSFFHCCSVVSEIRNQVYKCSCNGLCYTLACKLTISAFVNEDIFNMEKLGNKIIEGNVYILF